MPENDRLGRDVVELFSKIVERQIDTKELEMSLASIGIDSLIFLRLQMQVESEFGVSVPDDVDVDSMTGLELIALIDDQRSRLAS